MRLQKSVGLFEDVTLLAVHAKKVTVMPRNIRLALRIFVDHYRWWVTPENAACYEQHNRRKTDGGGLPIISWINNTKNLFILCYVYVLYFVVLKTILCYIANRIKCCIKTHTKLMFIQSYFLHVYISFLPNTISLVYKHSQWVNRWSVK